MKKLFGQETYNSSNFDKLESSVGISPLNWLFAKFLLILNNCFKIDYYRSYRLLPGKFEIMSDGSWNVRGFCSPLGTVSALGMKTNKIVGVSVMINEGKYKNCNVTSKAMEGLGSEKRICEFLKNNGIVVTSFLHDGDGSAFNGVVKYFPQCLELRCINHAAKNMGKWAKEIFGERFGTKMRYSFWHACRNASLAPDPALQLRNEFVVMLNHFGGVHTLCRHHKDKSKPQKWYLDKSKVEILN